MIKAIITDFDGTLVDTFEANFLSYQKVLEEVGINLTAEKYQQCFGYRIDRFMSELSVDDDKTIEYIKAAKRAIYPNYFNFLRPNQSLIKLIEGFHQMGGKTAIASTAQKDNLMKACEYLGITNLFDVIYAGTDVKQGKPSPEIYIKTMQTINVAPAETLIFEDSKIGIASAKASGAQIMIVHPSQFDNQNIEYDGN